MGTPVTLHGGSGSDTINFAFTVTGTNTTRYTMDFVNAVNQILSGGGTLTPVTGTSGLTASVNPAQTTPIYDLKLPSPDTINSPSFVISNAGYVVDTISGSANIDLASGADTVLVAAINAQASVVGSGGNNRVIFVTGENTFNGTNDGSGDTIVGGSGTDTILTSKAGSTIVNTGTGYADIVLQDTTASSNSAFVANDLVYIDDGHAIVSANGTADAVIVNAAGQTVLGGSSTGTLGVVLTANGTASDINAGSEKVTAVFDDGQNNTIVGGSGLLYFIGSANVSADIMTSTGTALIYGASGDNLTLTNGLDTNGSPAAGSTVFIAGAGNETLNGAGSTANLFLFGNADTTGGSTDSIVGGYGNDLLVAGQGSETLTGGLGSNTFLFDAAASANGSITVSDFLSGNNTLDLAGFSDTTGVLNGQSTDAGYVVTLNSTTITFTGVTSGSQLASHVVSF